MLAAELKLDAERKAGRQFRPVATCPYAAASPIPAASTARSTTARTEATGPRVSGDASKACGRGASSAMTTSRRSCAAASARVSARLVAMRSRRAAIPGSAASR